MNLQEEIEFIKFRQDLLFQNTDFSKFLYESGITKGQYEKIINLVEKYRKSIRENKKVHHGNFEQSIYKIVPEKKGSYHFAECILYTLYEQGRWEEVFINLYGHMPKYQFLFKDK